MNTAPRPVIPSQIRRTAFAMAGPAAKCSRGRVDGPYQGVGKPAHGTRSNVNFRAYHGARESVPKRNRAFNRSLHGWRDTVLNNAASTAGTSNIPELCTTDA